MQRSLRAPAPPPTEPAVASFMSRSATVALLRVINALRDGWFLEKRLRDVARMIAADARDHGLRAEQMLVALKREWPVMLERRRVPGDDELGMLAERLVSLCIQEYYRDTRQLTVNRSPL